MEELAVFTMICAFVAALIWLVIGWRAMRAHERIAESLGEFLASQVGNPAGTPTPGSASDCTSSRQGVIDRLTHGGN